MCLIKLQKTRIAASPPKLSPSTSVKNWLGLEAPMSGYFSGVVGLPKPIFGRQAAIRIFAARPNTFTHVTHCSLPYPLSSNLPFLLHRSSFLSCAWTYKKCAFPVITSLQQQEASEHHARDCCTTSSEAARDRRKVLG